MNLLFNYVITNFGNFSSFMRDPQKSIVYQTDISNFNSGLSIQKELNLIKCKEDTMSFVGKDLNTLFSLDESGNDLGRKKFLLELDNTLGTDLEKLKVYKSALDSLVGGNSESVRINLQKATEFYHSSEGKLEWHNAFLKTKDFVTPDFILQDRYNIELLSEALLKCSDEQINSIIYFLNYHEQFTLASMEPYMIFILGNSIFLNLFLPFHYEGNFKFFMGEAIDKRNTILHPFRSKVKSLIKWVPGLNKFLNFYKSPAGSTTVMAASYVIPKLFNYFLGVPAITPDVTKSEVAIEAVDKLLNRQQGFNSPMLNSLINLSGSIGYEFGKIGGTFTHGFGLGVMSKWENELKGGASMIDTAIDNKHNSTFSIYNIFNKSFK